MNWDCIIFDLDGVLLDVYSSWVWVHQHFGTNNDDSLNAYKRGEIDDLEFMRRDIALWLEKEPALTIERVRDILYSVPIMAGTERLTGKLRGAGTTLAIVSGGIDLVAEWIGERYGFARVIANGLAVDAHGRLTGEGVLRVPLRDKGTPAREIIEENGFDPARCCAIGNSAIDAGMFAVCGLGIAFAPIDQMVIDAADVVVHEHDLGTLTHPLQLAVDSAGDGDGDGDLDTEPDLDLDEKKRAGAGT